ncbi:phosphodiester glycosidase family protein [Paenibacillus sacheonensis]|uniref:Phosphodiester glycosidase family protein n=1 Tax=Paenibacillus sacheonensis TaxID=742054 RepID=A0A7X4YLX0_9BACL|nr:phosphodiester glycosidase family protein [Paenibacillus sacheonensis]MBM7563414.1 exopolysaccharide biosynthesis protein [Paenibacillus sacheonensis]NBC68031.1 phosphodiester glycosidase family protein [Paenibacillus sacheonensis]
MTLTVKRINRFCLLACAPFIGLVIWLLAADLSITLPDSAFPKQALSDVNVPADTGKLTDGLDSAKQKALVTAKSLKKSIALYTATGRSMNAIVTLSDSQADRPYRIYDRRITLKIGSPAQQIQSDNIRAQLFTIHAQYFSGYALKVKLKTPDAMKMVLGQDKNGGAETTLAAARRYGAIAGVNAGGFADDGGKRYPLSTTVMNGSYLNGFDPSFKDLFFVGLNDNLELIGGKYSSREQLDKQNPKFGASFVPVLLQNGRTSTIPSKWQTSPLRAPRTVVANYKDNQLLFLVIDGRNENGSSGATLEEVQILLQRFGAIDGYNLDGGGSSTLVFNGRVVNHPSDGRLRPVPTHFLFFK